MYKLIAFVVVVLLAVAVMGFAGQLGLPEAAVRVDSAVMYTVHAADAVPTCDIWCVLDSLPEVR